MSDFIGVKKLSDYQVNPSFKKDALIFDRIAISGVADFARMLPEGFNREDCRRFGQELAWLLDSGIVFQPQFTAQENAALRKNNELKSIGKLIAEHKKLPHKLKLNIDTDFWNWWEVLNDYRTRTLAVMLRVGHKLDAYPISSLTELKGNQLKNEVVTVIIKDLPTPNESTSWEQIIEYRSDLDSRSKFLAIRNWMTEISKEHVTPVEVEQKLEYLMDQYERHMKLHKMKVNRGVFETVVVSTAELAEDLVKFKWGKLAQSLFALKRRRIALLEAELTAPGSAVAYIWKSREVFK